MTGTSIETASMSQEPRRSKRADFLQQEQKSVAMWIARSS